MTSSVQPSNDDLVVSRWRSWLAQVGRDAGTVERQVTDRSPAPGAGGSSQLFLRQLFARADLEERRSLDLLLAVFIELKSGPRLLVLGSGAIRAQSVAGTTGFVVSEIGLAQALPDLRVSLAMLRIDRASRARDVAASIESLGRLLDYEYDPDGSASVAHAIIRRLEVLTAGPGVRVSVAGVVNHLGDESLRSALHLLTDVTLGLDDDIEFRDGRLVIVSGGDAAASSVAVPLSGQRGEGPSARDVQVGRERRGWTGGDYALLRVGQAVARRSDVGRPLAQRRVEHALAEVSLLSAVTQEAGSYSSRAASGRQAARAQETLERALAGEQDIAVTLLSAALTQPGARGPLVENVVAGVGTVAEFWTVLPIAERALNEAERGTESHTAAMLLQTRLIERLDHLLRLGLDGGAELMIPVTTPIVVQVSDLLVPIVDARQDDGLFLFELIPAMRDRLCDDTGVWIPGVRARGNPNLPPGRYSAEIDEVPVSEGTVTVAGRYRARLFDGGVIPDDAEVAEVHPLTSEPGRWLIEAALDDDATETISAAQYLTHRLETVIRAHLSALLGMQEVTALLDRWRAAEPDLVRRAVVDPVAVERLTVLLQGLVAERVPIADWRAVLGAVVAAGGIDTPLGDLHTAVRWRLRAGLPGPRSGPAFIAVPPEMQAGLSGGPGHLDPGVAAADIERTRVRFLGWLRSAIKEHRSVISLVTETTATRVVVAALARSEDAVVLTFTEEEVAAE
jgi:hypothetical protein